MENPSRTFFLLVILCVVGRLKAYECDVLGVEIKDSEGIIESPSPDAKSQNCIWLFEVAEGKVLKLKFTEFELRRQQLCENSFVEFTSQEYNEVRFCGDQKPPVLTFAGPGEVMFYTRIGRRETIKVAGYKAEFWTEDSYVPCSGKEQCGNGRCFNKNKKCNGVDDCGDGTDEEGCGHQRTEPILCGRPMIPPVSGNYIAGGRDSVPGSWPWQVSLQLKEIFPSGHFCGATLIDNLWVLTAAHCFETRNASMVRARFGNYDTFANRDDESIRNVEKVFSHPEYDPDLIENDIALLKLAAPVKFTNTISPACLPEIGEKLSAGSLMYATGWGDGKNMEKVEVLRQAMMPLIDFELCNRLYFGEVNPNTLCTHYEQGGHSVCMGDSGGPLVHQKEKNWKVYGVVSWGHEDCGHRFWPSVYTEVSAFMPWIKRIIDRN